MALTEIAVQGMTLEYTNPTVSGALPTVTGSPSTKVSADGKGAYQNGLSITVPSGITDTATSCVTSNPVNTTIVATSQKTLVEGVSPLRAGDETVSLTIPGLIGGQTACSVITAVRISGAGQTKVLAE